LRPTDLNKPEISENQAHAYQFNRFQRTPNNPFGFEQPNHYKKATSDATTQSRTRSTQKHKAHINNTKQ